MHATFQLRLDFNTFVIAGPSSDSASVLTILNGLPATNTGVPASNRGRCLTDSFSVTSSNSAAPPTICGTNSDQHSMEKQN